MIWLIDSQVAVLAASSPPDRLEETLIHSEHELRIPIHFSLVEPGSDFAPPENPFLVDLANGLMNRIPHLKRVRSRLVPKRLSEDLFWSKYFSLIQSVVVKTICPSSH